MSNLICPFCGHEYIITKDDSCFGQQRCVCRNPNCEFDGWHFPVKLVSKLIRTRKALDIAVDALKELRPEEKKSCFLVPTVSTTQRIIDEALEQITALEQ